MAGGQSRARCRGAGRSGAAGTGVSVGWLAAQAVRGYQLLLRPLSPPCCRFVPGCSEYARIVLLRHGLVRGGWLGLRRLGRCHPWNPGGYDPPPPARPGS
jgi:putative membrane protein insertion efficiency factor